MPLVTAFNLRREDPLRGIEEAVRRAMASLPGLGIQEDDVDVVPLWEPDAFRGVVARINVDLWEDRRAPRMLSKNWRLEWREPSRGSSGRTGR
jgi:hypothetical protein